MSWFDLARRMLRRRGSLLVPLAGILALSGCGFQPMYARTESTPVSLADRMATIRIAPLPDHIGQQMHNLLRDRLNPRGQPREPAYLLKLSLSESRHELGVRKDETATRANLFVSASFSLREMKSKRVVLSGSTTSVNSYNILTGQFATTFSENDARKRALRELSDTIRTRLGIYFSKIAEDAS